MQEENKDSNPNDTNPARLTGIFSQDEIDNSIQSRKDDSFYAYDGSKKLEKISISEDDDIPLDREPARFTPGGSFIGIHQGQIIHINF